MERDSQKIRDVERQRAERRTGELAEANARVLDAQVRAGGYITIIEKRPSCPQCAVVQGVAYPADLAPPIPIAQCTSAYCSCEYATVEGSRWDVAEGRVLRVIYEAHRRGDVVSPSLIAAETGLTVEVVLNALDLLAEDRLVRFAGEAAASSREESSVTLAARGRREFALTVGGGYAALMTELSRRADDVVDPERARSLREFSVAVERLGQHRIDELVDDTIARRVRD